MQGQAPVEDVFDGDAKGAFRAYAEQEAGGGEKDLLAEKEGAGWVAPAVRRLPAARQRWPDHLSALLESAWFKD